MQPEIVHKAGSEVGVITVLYVDDEAMLLDIVKLFLERYGSVRVDTASSADDAIRMLDAKRYDVVVSDYQMPGMSGIELLKYVRPRFHIPFILFTGRGREEVAIDAINNGATFYLQKGGDPKVQFAELLHKVRLSARAHRSEEEVIRSRNRYASYFNLPLIGVFTVSPEGRWIELNEKACTTLGYSCDELQDKSWGELIPPQDRAGDIWEFGRIFSGEIPSWTTTKKFIRKDGTVIDAEISLMPVRDVDGKIEYCMGIIQDVTEQKRMEHELSESTNRFRELADLLPISVFEVDTQGFFTFANRQTLVTSRYTEEDFRLGLHYTQLISPEERGRGVESGDQVLRHGKTNIGIEYLFIRKDGTTFPGMVYNSPIIRNGTITGLRGIMMDLSQIRIEEEKFSTVFYNNPALMVISHLETGKLVDVNRAFEQHTGYRRDEVIGRETPDLGLISREDLIRIRSSVQSGKGSREHEIRIRTKSGDVRTLLISGDILLFDDEQYLLTHAIDITEWVAAEEASKQTQALLKSLINAMPDIVCFKDGAGRWLQANTFTQQLFQIDEHSWHGHTDEEIAAYNPQYNAIFQRCRETDETAWQAGRVMRGIEYIPDTNGAELCFDIIKVPSFLKNGARAGLFLIGRDITEKQHTLHELEKAELLLKTVYEQNPTPMLLITIPDNIVRIMNSACIDHLGIPDPETCIGAEYSQMLRYFRLYDPDGILIPPEQSPIIGMLQGKRTYPQEMKIIRVDGSERWHIISCTPIYDHGDLIAGLVIFPDITTQKQTERALGQANRKLNLLSSITRHDTMNSITALLSYLDLLTDPPDGIPVSELNQRCVRISQKIRDQIAFTKDYQELGVKAACWHDPEKILREKWNLLDTGGVQIFVNLNGLSVFADPLFEQVIYNLLENALRYGEKISRISSFYERDPNGLRWIFSDDGAGVPDGMKEKIFEKNVGKNTGLGLFLSREILEITQISIHETGTFGNGACFEMEIPPGMYRFHKEIGLP